MLEIDKTTSKSVKIKLQEVSKLIKELDKRHTIKNNHLVDLLQYHQLLQELTSSNG
jgi:ABC-type lipoprotein export system ATPase subunit